MAEVIRNPETNERYRLGALLGAGGFGRAYRAVDETGDIVCVKLTKDQDSWHREAYMAALVGHHPRVVTVLDTFPVVRRSGIEYAVVMELADCTLWDLIQREQWTERRAVSEIRHLLSAVGELHASGALHRDITPWNVFASGQRLQLKLGDFGIARHGPPAGVPAWTFNAAFVDSAVARLEQRVWGVPEDLWQVAQLLCLLLRPSDCPSVLTDVKHLPASDSTRFTIARAIGTRRYRFGSAAAMADSLRSGGGVSTGMCRSLSGRNVVFTGKMSIPRKEAARRAQAAGARVLGDVGPGVDVIVQGDATRLYAAGAAGMKLIAVAALQEEGQPIAVIDEARFLKLA